MTYNPMNFFVTDKPGKRSNRIICEFDHRQFWQNGSVRDMPDIVFEAKIYDAPSRFGIEGGRISKLNVHERQAQPDGETVCIMNYQRGWDQKPKGRAAKRLLRDIVQYFDHELEWPGKASGWAYLKD